MSIAAEKLPLLRRDVRKKSSRAATLEKELPRRKVRKKATAPLARRDGFQKNVSNFTTLTVLD